MMNNSNDYQEVSKVEVIVRINNITNKKDKIQYQIQNETLKANNLKINCNMILDQNKNNNFICLNFTKLITNDLINGQNAFLFAYGWSGSGKTHTLFGSDYKFNEVKQTNLLHQIFQNMKDTHRNYRYTISFFEIIYNLEDEIVIDLLDNRKQIFNFNDVFQQCIDNDLELDYCFRQALTNSSSFTQKKSFRGDSIQRFKNNQSHFIAQLNLINQETTIQFTLLDLIGFTSQGDNLEQLSLQNINKFIQQVNENKSKNPFDNLQSFQRYSYNQKYVQSMKIVQFISHQISQSKSYCFFTPTEQTSNLPLIKNIQMLSNIKYIVQNQQQLLDLSGQDEEMPRAVSFRKEQIDYDKQEIQRNQYKQQKYFQNDQQEIQKNQEQQKYFQNDQDYFDQKLKKSMNILNEIDCEDNAQKNIILNYDILQKLLMESEDIRKQQKSDIELLKNDIQQLVAQHEIKQQNQKIKKLELEQQMRTIKECSDQNQIIQFYEKKMKDLKNKIKALKNNKIQVEEKIDDREKNDVLNKQLKKKDEEIYNLQQENKKLEKSQNFQENIGQKINAFQKQIKEKTQDLQTLQEQNMNLQNQVQVYKDDNYILQEKTIQQTKEIDDLQQQLYLYKDLANENLNVQREYNSNLKKQDRKQEDVTDNLEKCKIKKDIFFQQLKKLQI